MNTKRTLFFVIVLCYNLMVGHSQPSFPYRDSLRIGLERSSMSRAANYTIFYIENLSSRRVWVPKNTIDGYKLNSSLQWIEPLAKNSQGICWEILDKHKRNATKKPKYTEGEIRSPMHACSHLIVFPNKIFNNAGNERKDEIVSFLFYLLAPYEKKIVYAKSELYHPSETFKMDIGKYPYARLVMSQNAMQIRKRFFEGTKYEASLDSVLIFDGILYSTPASITSIRYSWLEERTYYEKHIDQSPCDSSRMVGDYVPLTREELESTLPEFMRTKKDSIP